MKTSVQGLGNFVYTIKVDFTPQQKFETKVGKENRHLLSGKALK